MTDTVKGRERERNEREKTQTYAYMRTWWQMLRVEIGSSGVVSTVPPCIVHLHMDRRLKGKASVRAASACMLDFVTRVTLCLVSAWFWVRSEHVKGWACCLVD